MTCQRVRMRAQYVSEQQRKLRYERNREYKAIQRRRSNVPVRRLKNPNGNYGEGRAMKKTGMFLDSQRILKYLEKYIQKEKFNPEKSKTGRAGAMERLLLNGILLSETDSHYIAKMRRGVVERVSLDHIDKLFVKHKLPLWEIDNVIRVADSQESSKHDF